MLSNFVSASVISRVNSELCLASTLLLSKKDRTQPQSLQWMPRWPWIVLYTLLRCSLKCLNDCLREHHNIVYKHGPSPPGHPILSCVPFDKSEVLAKHKSQLTREVVEEDLIRKFDNMCVSTPSIALPSHVIYLNRHTMTHYCTQCCFYAQH